MLLSVSLVCIDMFMDMLFVVGRNAGRCLVSVERLSIVYKGVYACGVWTAGSTSATCPW